MSPLAQFFRAGARNDGVPSLSGASATSRGQPQPASTSHASANVEALDLSTPTAPGSPDREDRSFAEIIAPRMVVFRGVGQDVEPVRLLGAVVLHLAEPVALRDVTLEFTGKAKLPVPPTPNLKPQNAYTIYAHEMSFMPHQGSDKRQSRTFKAGRHTFPFDIELEPYLPSTLRAPRAEITYKLRATAVRSSMLPNFTCTLPVHVVRSFGSNSLEYQQTIEVESTWAGKLMYSLTLPHKAWAAGDTITTLVKFQPLVKGVSVCEVRSILTETTQYSGLPGIEMRKDVCSARHMFSAPASSSHPAPADAQQNNSTNASHQQSAPSAQLEVNVSRATDASGQRVDTDESQDSELVAKVELKIPTWTCPSHSVAPVNVSHRMVWVIAIKNADGHSSELRCSLPVNILSHHVLEEAIQASAPTRRLLFGIDDLVLPVSEQVELPSYNAHVQDPVANATDGWPTGVNHSTALATSQREGNSNQTARGRSLSNPSTARSAAVATGQQSQGGSRSTGRTSTRPTPGAGSSTRRISSRALSVVPDYDAAARGGVPPLSSAVGLPSYDEAAPGLRARQIMRRSCSDSELRRSPRANAGPSASGSGTARRRPARPPPSSAGKATFLWGPSRMVPPGVPFASTWLAQQRTMGH